VKLTVQEELYLDKFSPRFYQLPLFDAIENKGYKKVIAVLPRRCGKDISGFNLAFRWCLKRIGTIYYIFPTYAQGKRALWDARMNTGERIIDYIPDSIIESKNSNEMKIRLFNGSCIQIVGSDNYDALRGSNPMAAVFSEYAYQDHRAYTEVIRPILTANDGWALFLSTPFGKNHFWDLYNIAKNIKEWFVLHATVDVTRHISPLEIDKERREGIMSEDLIQQEYYCSFEMGVEGSFYSKYLNKARLDGRIGSVPWESAYRVHTAWDLGWDDATAIIFFQRIGTSVRIIDCYENNKEGLEHYVNVVRSKPYTYGTHIVPHDINVHDLSTGITRREKVRNLGLETELANSAEMYDGIEAVRSQFSRVWIDEKNAGKLISSLENYRQEWDSKRKVYTPRPLHDWASHFADAMRYLCVSLDKTVDGLSAADLDRRYLESVYGSQGSLPSMFR